MSNTAIPHPGQGGPPGRPGLFDVQSFMRRYIPFSGRFLANQKSGPRGQYVTVQFGTANVDVSVPLALGHVPSGYIPVGQTKAGSIYNGTNEGSDWTPSAIVLRCDAASNKVNLYVF